MAANLFNQCIWLAEIIFKSTKRGGITFDEINKLWMRSQYNESGDSYPERSFYRHKNKVKELFDIDIECDKRTGRYTIAHADDIDKGGVRTWLLNTFAINNLINESHHLKRRILFEEIPSGQEFLTTVIEAMRDGKTLEITYQGFGKAKASTFEIAPYCVKVFKQRWYVLANSLHDDIMRIYALDRVLDVMPTENDFQLPSDFEAKKYFEDSFGIIVDKNYPAELVEIKVHGGQCEYFRTLPLHPSQSELETTPEYSVFEVYLRPTYDFVQELRRYGSDVEVLSPEWLREDMAVEIQHTAARYAEDIK